MTAKQKRELLAMPVAPPPEIIVDPITYTGDNYLYSVTEHCSEAGTVVAMTIYTTTGKPLFRTFQSKEALISQYLDGEQRASDTTLDNVRLGEHYSYNNRYHGTAEDDQKLFKLLEKSSPIYLTRRAQPNYNGYDFLREYQRRLREYDLKCRYDRIRAALDGEMLEIRPLPQKVKNWVDSTLMKHSRYVFYDYKKGKKTMNGSCTHCGHTVQIKHPRHQTSGKCPHCHTAITYLAHGNYRESYSSVVDKKDFAYLQSTKAGWCVRYFNVKATHYPNKSTKGNLYSYHEYARSFYRSDDRDRPQSVFCWENFRNTGEYRFCKSSYSQYGGSLEIYPDNLDILLCTDDPYTPYRQIAKRCGALRVSRLISEPRENRQVEYLFKLGLYRLCADAVSGALGDSINTGGRSILEKFGLPKSDLPQLREINPNRTEFELYKHIRAKNNRIDTEVFMEILKLTTDSNLRDIKKALSYQTPSIVLQYIQKQVAQRLPLAVKTPTCYCGAYGARPETAKEREQYIQNDVIGNWGDYLDECIQLKLNLNDSQVLRPRDLAAAHEKTSAEVAVIKNKKEAQRRAGERRAENKKIAVLVKQLTKLYAFEADGLFIRPFVSCEEVKAEGTALHHCVGSYTARYADGISYLFCIRMTEYPDTPYYTLEFNPKNGSVTQYKGYRNDAPNNYKPDSKVTAFKEKWLKKIVNPLYKKQEKERVQASA